MVWTGKCECWYAADSWWVIFVYYVSGRQRDFNGILPGSRGTVYADNPSGEVSFLITDMMIAVIIHTALFNPPWFLLMQTLMMSQKYLRSILQRKFLMLTPYNTGVVPSSQWWLLNLVAFPGTSLFNVGKKDCLLSQYHSSFVKCCKLYSPRLSFL